MPSQDSTPVILISVDTLRADHLGCCAYQKLRTPHLDALARGGTIYRAVTSPVPLTLPTIAGVLKLHGYRPAAFIGGYVLDANFGLNQGFDFYDSPFRVQPKPGEEPPDLKRSAETGFYCEV